VAGIAGQFGEGAEERGGLQRLLDVGAEVAVGLTLERIGDLIVHKGGMFGEEALLGGSLRQRQKLLDEFLLGHGSPPMEGNAAAFRQIGSFSM
jgi:hypothetical protein